MFKRDSDTCLTEFKYWIKVGMKDSKAGLKIFHKKKLSKSIRGLSIYVIFLGI